MIILNYINNNGFLEPERTLTDIEKLSVTSVLGDGQKIYYFQGDEPTSLNSPLLDEVITEEEAKKGWSITLINFFKKLFSNE
jgi:hypothetical protein